MTFTVCNTAVHRRFSSYCTTQIPFCGTDPYYFACRTALLPTHTHNCFYYVFVCVNVFSLESVHSTDNQEQKSMCCIVVWHAGYTRAAPREQLPWDERTGAHRTQTEASPLKWVIVVDGTNNKGLGPLEQLTKHSITAATSCFSLLNGFSQ